MAKSKKISDEAILKNATFNHNTIYTGQYTFVCDDGYEVHSVYIEGNLTKKVAEENLIVAVREHLEN